MMPLQSVEKRWKWIYLNAVSIKALTNGLHSYNGNKQRYLAAENKVQSSETQRYFETQLWNGARKSNSKYEQ